MGGARRRRREEAEFPSGYKKLRNKCEIKKKKRIKLQQILVLLKHAERVRQRFQKKK